MTQSPQQWLEQADYDLATAEVLLREERYFYAVFMCHLSLEKALKGLYQARAASPPPRTHNLVFLLNRAGVQADEVTAKFLVLLSEAQIATRYPEDSTPCGSASRGALWRTSWRRPRRR